MTPRYQRVISLFILSFTLFNLTNAALVLPSCELQNYHDVNSGLVSFFDYDPSDTISYRDIDFLSRGYLETNYFGSIPAIYDINWDSGPYGNIPPYEYYSLERPFPVKNFLMTIMGFYFTTQSGIHKVNIEVADLAGVALFMGTQDSFDCCAQMTDYTGTGTVYTNAVGQSNIPQDIYLEAGTSYPFTLVYVNNGGPGGLKMQVTLPDGSVDDTIGNNLYAFLGNDASQCEAVTPTYVFPTSSTTTNSGSTAIPETTTATSENTDTSSAIIPETTTVTTVTSDISSKTVSETNTLTSDTIIPETTTVTTGPTGTISNTIPETTTIASGNTDTSSATIPETTSVTSSSSSVSLSDTTITNSITTGTETAVTTSSNNSDSVTEITTAITTVTTGTRGTTIPETSTITSYSSTVYLTEATIITATTGGMETITSSFTSISSINSDDLLTTTSATTTNSTIRETGTTISHGSGSKTEETTITNATTNTDSNIMRVTSAATSYNSASITEETTTPNTPTGTDGSTTFETNYSITPVISHTSGSVTVATNLTNLYTCTDSSTTPETTTVITSFSSRFITTKIWPSSSSSTRIQYSNSKSRQPSSCVTSHIDPFPSTPSGSGPAAQHSSASPGNKSVTSHTTHNAPNNKLTSTVTHDGDRPNPGNEDTPNINNDRNASVTYNDDSSNNDMDGQNKNSVTATVSTVKPSVSVPTPVTPLLSVSEGAGALNKKQSLASLLAMVILAFV